MRARKEKGGQKATERRLSDDRTAGFARWVVPAFVALVTFVVFHPALQNGFVEWDDDKNFLNNPHYRGLGWKQIAWMFSTFHMGHYQPLSWLTLGLDYLLWGMDPRGYHLTSVVFHAANSVLFYFLCVRLIATARSLQEPRQDLGLALAGALAALFFALHPLRVESVAWVTERRDVVSGLFLLVAVLFYLRAAGAGAESLPRRCLGASLGFYLLSLLSKAAGITLPFVLLALDFYPLRRLGWDRGWLTRQARAVLLEKVPFLVLAAAFGVVALLAQSERALKTFEEHGLVARVAQAFFGLAFYPRKTLLPVGLSPLYQLRPDVSWSSWPLLLSGFCVVAVTVLLFLAWKRWPAGLVVWISYVALAAPVLGVAQSGPQLVADRYSYLSCLGFAVLLGAGAYGAWKTAARAVRLAALGVGISVLVVAAGITRSYIAVWRDSERLWRHAVSVDPRSDIAQNNLGSVLLDKDRLEEAIERFRKAAEINPRSPSAPYNLGLALTKAGDLKGAIRSYREALRIAPESPEVMNNLGIALATDGDIVAALEQFHNALRYARSRAETHFNLATVFARQGRYSEALEHFEKAAALRADFAQAHHRAGSVLVMEGKVEAALPRFRRALEIDPMLTDARVDLATALARQGRLDEAIREFEELIRLEPGSAKGYNGLGRLLAAKGELDRAIALFREALRLDPSFAPARESLEMALAEKQSRLKPEQGPRAREAR